MHIVEANYRSSKLPNVAGYGFIPYPQDKQDLYTDAADALYQAISTGGMPDGDDTWKRRCNNLSRLFGSVSSQGDAAWYLNSEMLGHPSPEVAGRLAVTVSEIGRAIAKGNRRRFREGMEALKSDHADAMLDSYLDVALRGQTPVEEPEWAYIIWSNRPDGILRIGATTDDLRTFAGRLNRSSFSSSPISVLAAWPVHDADDAAITIANRLRSYRASEGHYFIKLADARNIVETGLKETENFVLSPFHLEEDPAQMKTAKLTA